MRTHLILSEELVRQIDAMVGRRKRSRFVEEAVREKVRRDALVAALQATTGVLSSDEHREWSTSKKAAAWVRESRLRDDRRFERLGRG